jgi:hypothetical protein
MKKIILGVAAYMVLMANVYACQTQTIIINGKVSICTYCPNYVMCT